MRADEDLLAKVISFPSPSAPVPADTSFSRFDGMSWDELRREVDAQEVVIKALCDAAQTYLAAGQGLERHIRVLETSFKTAADCLQSAHALHARRDRVAREEFLAIARNLFTDHPC